MYNEEMKKPNIYLPIRHHHSPSDWWFTHANWVLSTTEFVSPPTSLKTTGMSLFVTCNLDEAECIPEGRVICSTMNMSWADPQGVVLRAQKNTGAEYQKNSYACFNNDGSAWVCRRFVGTTGYNIGWFDIPTSTETWYRQRITWWNGEDGNGDPALAVQIERWEAGEWVDYGTVFDTDNVWKDSAVNRCGIRTSGGAYHDDTEIWVPT